MKNIVVIGGGTGTFTVLSGLKKYQDVTLKAIVSMADNGGSTGLLRTELGVLPPGDIRQCLIALSNSPKVLSDLFMYRFEDGRLSGHNFGNIFLSALEKTTGDFEQAIIEAGKILNISGEVIPVSLESMNLRVELADGAIVEGEANIDSARPNADQPIKRLFLNPSVHATWRAIDAIKTADLVILGPGDLYTSLMPNLLVQGVVESLRQTRAHKVYICNLMTKHGQTNNFKASDFVRELERYIGPGIFDTVMLNTEKPGIDVLDLYASEAEYWVEPDMTAIEKMGYKVVTGNFLSTTIAPKIKADELKRSLLRHHSDKLGEILYKI